MRQSTLRVVPLIALVALAACSDRTTNVGTEGTTTPSGAATTVPASTDAPATAPVLQISTGGGFVPAEFAFGNVPEFTLYANGRVIVTGPTTMEYPGAALPNLQTGTIDAAAVRDAVEAAKKAGIGEAPDLGRPSVADAPTTTFVLVDSGHTSTLAAYALGMDDGPGLSAAQKAGRRRLSDLVSRMSTIGSDAATTPFRATAVSVLVRPVTAPEPGSPPAEPAPGEASWPLADLATGGAEQFGGRCLGFSGNDAQQVLAAASQARANSLWHSGATTWSLAFRPELPGTEPCAARP